MFRSFNSRKTQSHTQNRVIWKNVKMISSKYKSKKKTDYKEEDFYRCLTAQSQKGKVKYGTGLSSWKQDCKGLRTLARQFHVTQSVEEL